MDKRGRGDAGRRGRGAQHPNHGNDKPPVLPQKYELPPGIVGRGGGAAYAQPPQPQNHKGKGPKGAQPQQGRGQQHTAVRPQPQNFNGKGQKGVPVAPQPHFAAHAALQPQLQSFNGKGPKGASPQQGRGQLNAAAQPQLQHFKGKGAKAVPVAPQQQPQQPQQQQYSQHAAQRGRGGKGKGYPAAPQANQRGRGTYQPAACGKGQHWQKGGNLVGLPGLPPHVVHPAPAAQAGYAKPESSAPGGRGGWQGGGKGGRGSFQPTSEQQQLAGLQKLFDAFMASPEQTIDFKGLTPKERQMVHIQCDIHNLGHKSSGPETKRVLHVSKVASEELKTDDIYAHEQFSLRDTGAHVDVVEQTLRRFVDSRIFDEKIDATVTRKKRHGRFNSDDPHMKPRTGKLAPSANQKAIRAFADSLPASRAKPSIIKAVQSSRVIVVSGETGSGKTTQIPQILLDAGLVEGEIIVTQPRRISAISVATRIAQERNVAIGTEVGYQVRFEGCRSSATKLLFVTTGILLRLLEEDSSLKNVGCVVLDEVHERDADTDFSLLILKLLLRRRPHFKLVLMSATLQTEVFKKYMQDFSPAIVEIRGRAFPVTQHFLSQALAYIQEYNPAAMPTHRKQDEAAVKALDIMSRAVDGAPGDAVKKTLLQSQARARVDHKLIVALIGAILNCDKLRTHGILVFLPGWRDIEIINSAILSNPNLAPYLWVAKCHSTLSAKQQGKVFDVTPANLRKVVLATNIAETSITVPDIVYVIDSVVAKLTSYDANSDVYSLSNGEIAQSNVKQRMGRAGRTQAGMCFTLITEERYRTCLPETLPPELERIPLATTCLRVASLGIGTVREVLSAALDPPAEQAVQFARSYLVRMNAMTEDEKLTNLGRVLSLLPVEPLLGKVLLYGAIFRVLRPMCAIAAFLSAKSPFVKTAAGDMTHAADATKKRLAQQEFSDHTLYLKIYTVNRMTQQLLKLIQTSGFLKNGSIDDYSRHESNTGIVRAVLFAGLCPNMAWIGRGKSVKKGTYTGMTEVRTCDLNKVATIHNSSVNCSVLLKKEAFQLHNLSYLVYYERMFIESNLYIMDATLFSCVPVLMFAHVEWEGNVAVVERGWRRFSMSADDANLLRKMRHLLDFFFQKAIQRVDASLLPDDVLRSFAQLIEYPIVEQGTAADYNFEFSDSDESQGAEEADSGEYFEPEIVEEGSDAELQMPEMCNEAEEEEAFAFVDDENEEACLAASIAEQVDAAALFSQPTDSSSPEAETTGEGLEADQAIPSESPLPNAS
eukprot:gene12826-19770_t